MYRTPLHNIQLEAGGISANFGDWERIVLIGDPEAEAESAHKSAIIMDSSSFGKFSITGKDAAKAIGRVITKNIETLKLGQVTHFVSVDDGGCGIDDGVVCRISDNEYYLTTSTGRSALFEDWITTHCKGLGLDYQIIDLSHSLAAINLAGPRARKILAALSDEDISNQAFPFMSVLNAPVAGVPCKIMRVGFLGELGFEFHVPTEQAEHVWKKLCEAGEQYGAQITAIMGMSHLRLEKGHTIPGHDFDATATLFEAGLGFAWDRNHTGFIGEDALKSLEQKRPERCLVRFKTEGRSSVTPTSAMLAGGKEVGDMPSVHYSRLLDQTIGISFVKNSKELVVDGKAQIKTDDGIVEVDVIEGHAFFDPKGERMRG